MADRGLAVSLFLALRLQRPLFLEGEAGVGKTSLAAAAAAALDADLIRLQCYEGLDVGARRVRVGLRAPDAGAADSRGDWRRSSSRRRGSELYSEAFLIKRPLLQAIDPARTRPAVLLIDEIDRADEEFEGYLLELLAEFQITIPELGTVRATKPPLVILTSNRTREVHDALKRRCLYQWIEYPSFEKEMAIVHARVPHAAQQLARQVTALVHSCAASSSTRFPVYPRRSTGWPRSPHSIRDARYRGYRGHARRRAQGEGRHRGDSRRASRRATQRARRRSQACELGAGVACFVENLIVFGRLLRRVGFDVPSGSSARPDRSAHARRRQRA